MRLLIVALALIVSACMTAAPPHDADQAREAQRAAALDGLARDYVRLQLEIGQLEDGYIDAYYGPADLQEAARAHPRTIAQLKQDAGLIAARMAALGLYEPLNARRVDFLIAHLNAAAFRLDMIEGARAPFTQEAEALFGVRPDLKPLGDYDPVLARIEALVPGEGALADRVQAFRDRYVIPRERLEPVMRAAIAECRRRTLEHIALPENERFTLEFVTNQSWAGYNWFKGDAQSVIQINTDFPVYIDRALDLGCHEGYPGHHTHNVLLEQRLVRERGWVEHSVFPLYAPIAFIAEGEGNAGIDLAFPGDERAAFETRVLYPLAGLDPATAPAYEALREAMKDLQGARMTIGQLWLDGQIPSRDAALDLVQRYQLVSRERADQTLRFTDSYRSYIINYGLGEERVAAHLRNAGADQAARWAAMERVLSEPTLPSDLNH